MKLKILIITGIIFIIVISSALALSGYVPQILEKGFGFGDSVCGFAFC